MPERDFRFAIIWMILFLFFMCWLLAHFSTSNRERIEDLEIHAGIFHQ
jgi:hypothetical protein